jgi:signal transduction histidine kinase
MNGMKRIKLYLLFFCLALCLPLSFLIWRTYAGVAQEELAQLRFFAETRLDEMQRELAELVQREEGRSVEEYGHRLSPAGQDARPSPLAESPRETFILGYLQNNPDGSLQTPVVEDLRQVALSRRPLVDQLQDANRIFNQKKYALLTNAESEKPAPVIEKKEAPSPKSFADRYLAPSPGKIAKESLGQRSVRVEELTLGQAANIAKDEGWRSKQRADNEGTASSIDQGEEGDSARREQSAAAAPSAAMPPAQMQARFQVEVAPLQSVFIDDERVFIFRRVVINDRIFRQGFLIQLAPLLEHLARTHFEPHPMADFTRLRLWVLRGGRVDAEAPESGPRVADRTFPAPFNFIHAAVSGNDAPPSPARRLLDAALVALGAIMVLGLLAIYKSVRIEVELSERRSQFVSAVTHELKTPLTNIRMYVEMLEQGIAATPEREQNYLGIIGSESARLSRLINNVLELSRLEKKQRRMNLQPGRLAEVLDEVRAVMAPKLAQEGFELIFAADGLPAFAFDREALLQILINLVENSLKFGRDQSQRRITISARVVQAEVRIAVADTGPGIAKGALKKVFDDFYRADNALTRTTSGTGIGLALVRKLAQAMGGRVAAANNAGAGCTITVSLPFNAKESTSARRS